MLKKELKRLLEKKREASKNEDKIETKYLYQAIQLFQDTHTIRIDEDEVYTKRELYSDLLSALYYYKMYDEVEIRAKEALDYFEINNNYNKINWWFYAHLIAALLSNKKTEEAFELYEAYRNVNKELEYRPFVFEEDYGHYQKLVALQKQLVEGQNNSSKYVEIARIYNEYLYNISEALTTLDKALKENPNDTDALILQYHIFNEEEMFDEEELMSKYKIGLKLTNNHPDMVRAYIDFLYKYRDEVNAKIAIDLSLELIRKDETVDFEKLGIFYDEVADEKACFEALIKAVKEEKKVSAYIYRWLAYYYEEDLEDKVKALEYFKKYRNKNSVWCGDESDYIDEKIRELEGSYEDEHLSRYEKMKKLLLAEVEKNPTPSVYERLARNEYYSKEDKRENRLAFYEQGLAVFPNDLELLDSYIWFTNYNSDSEKSLKYLKRLIELHSEPEKYYHKIADIYKRNNYLEEALTYCIKDIEHNGGTQSWIVELSKKLGKDPIGILEETLKKSKNGATYGKLSELYFRKKEYEKSFTYVLEKIKYDKDSENAIGMAKQFYEKELFANAKELFISIYETCNDNSLEQYETLHLIGKCYLHENNIDKAEVYFKKAFKEDNEEVAVYPDLLRCASLFFRNDEVDKALTSYEFYTLKVDSKNDKAYNFIGKIYFEKEEFKKAVKAFKEALKLEPQNETYKANIKLAKQNIKGFFYKLFGV